MRLLALVLVLALPLTNAASADDEADREAMMSAYRTYQTSMSEGGGEAAIKAAREAYDIAKRLYSKPNKTLASFALNYGRTLTGDAQEKALKDALSLYESVYGKGAVELVDPLIDLGNNRVDARQPKLGQSYFNQALALVKKHKGPDDQLAGLLNLEIGKTALHGDKPRDSLKYLKKAESIFQMGTDATAEQDLAVTRLWLGQYHLAAADPQAATDLLLASLHTLEKTMPDSPLVTTNHTFLIRAYEALGRRDEATKHCLAVGAATTFNPDEDFRPIVPPRPYFPNKAVDKRINGSVTFTVTVDKEGFARNPKIIERSSEEASVFDNSAIAASKWMRYIPRFEKGEPVETHDVKYRLTFNIAN